MRVRGRIWSTRPVGLLAGGLLGAGAALLVSCGSNAKLIPLGNSEPLQKDFEDVARAAEGGHGSCSATEAALAKADQDFAGLPASVDTGLRGHKARHNLAVLYLDTGRGAEAAAEWGRVVADRPDFLPAHAGYLI